MPWVKISDDFPKNVKVISAGLEARALYVTALCHCNEKLTDGFVDPLFLPALAMITGITDLEGCIDKLLEVGLWEAIDGGYIVHDYHDYNPTKEQALKTREERAKAGQKGGIKSAASKTQAKPKQIASKTEAKVNPVPVPVPVPDPQREESPPSAAAKPPHPPPKTPKPATPAQAMFSALAELCQVDIATCTTDQRGALNQSEALLRKAGATPEVLGVHADDWQTFAHWWYRHDWRGKKGEPPKPHQVREEWGKFTSWRVAGQTVEVALRSESIELTPDEQLWQRILADLQGRMARETFNAHLLGSMSAGRNDGCLRVILVRPDSAIWLRERLYDNVVHPCVEQHEPGLSVEFVCDAP